MPTTDISYSDPNPRTRLIGAAVDEAVALDEVKRAMARSRRTAVEVKNNLLGGGLSLPQDLEKGLEEYARLDDYRKRIESLIRNAANPWREREEAPKRFDILERVLAPIWLALLIFPFWAWDKCGDVLSQWRRSKRELLLYDADAHLDRHDDFARSRDDAREAERERFILRQRLRRQTTWRARVRRVLLIVLLLTAAIIYSVGAIALFVGAPIAIYFGWLDLSSWFALPGTALFGVSALLFAAGLAVRAARNWSRLGAGRKSTSNDLDYSKRVELFGRLDSVVQEDPDYRAASAELDDFGRVLERELLERCVLPAIRDLLNLGAREAANPREFLIVSARGLGEVDDDRFEIKTASMARLTRTLRQLPGGSIGLSGPRGVGKTTILRSITSSAAADTLWPERTLPVRLSAPVDYVPVEFVSHLAAELCRAILGPRAVGLSASSRAGEPEKDEGTHQAAEATRSDSSVRSRLNAFRRSPWLWRGVTFVLLCLIYALGVGLTSDLGTSPTIQWQVRHALPLACAVVVVALIGAARWKASFQRGAWRWLWLPQLALTVSLLGLIWLNLGDRIRELRAEIRLWSLLALLILTLAIVSHVVKRRILSADQDSGAQASAEGLAEGETQSSLPAGLQGEAESLLAALQFAESKQTGSGSKLSVGGTAGIELRGELSTSRQSTLSRRDMSMPELVARLRRLIELATAHRRVLVAIDELDKIADETSARRFLNDIKSIFGVYRSYFVVAVSQDAMVSFERRGLAIRTEVDSAFDEVIDAAHMSLEETRAFLECRVEGLTEPFVQLCYCLSGGLPRDAIRTMRNIVNAGLSAENKRIYLPRVTTIVVLGELSRYAAATLSRQDIADEDWPLDVFQVLSKIRRQAVHPSRLIKLASEVRIDTASVVQAAARVRYELHVVLQYYAEVFALFASQNVAPEAFAARLEEITQARRDLAQNLYFAAQSVNQAVRPQEMQVEVLDYSPAPLAQGNPSAALAAAQDTSPDRELA